MNIFFMPSWYPSDDAPLAGIFSKEQAASFAAYYPGCHVGISLWGQKNEGNLLWANDHVKNLPKLIKFTWQQERNVSLTENYHEFYTPALTWTDKILNGNMKKIIWANDQNFSRFSARFGKPSLIHAHVAFPAGYIAMHLAHKHKLPYLITEQMSPFPFACYTTRGRIRPKVTKPIKQANVVIAISPHAATDIHEKTGVQPMCIPNLVNESLFAPSKRPVPPFPFTFFSLGRMLPQKGFPDLLQSITYMKHTDALFRIAGEGANKAVYQELAKEHGVSNRIQWLGKLSRTEAAHEFQNCHGFVLPSIHESMGVVYAEAIACGKPIIATRCGGPEFIVNQDNGVLVDVNAPEQLAQAMDTMIENYSRYKPDVIRKDFLERFSSEVITKKIYSVYEAIAAKKPLPADLFPHES